MCRSAIECDRVRSKFERETALSCVMAGHTQSSGPLRHHAVHSRCKATDKWVLIGRRWRRRGVRSDGATFGLGRVDRPIIPISLSRHSDPVMVFLHPYPVIVVDDLPAHINRPRPGQPSIISHRQSKRAGLAIHIDQKLIWFFREGVGKSVGHKFPAAGDRDFVRPKAKTRR